MPIEPANTRDSGFDPALNQPANQAGASPLIMPPGILRKYSSHWDFAEIDDIEIPHHWSVPWSDLMMVMMVMFAVMFVIKMAEMDIGELFKKEAQAKPELRPKLQPRAQQTKELKKVPISAEEILRLSEKLVTEANLEEVDVVLTENHAIKVSVRGNLLFDLGKADLKPDAIFFLDKLSQIIAANNYQIEVVGHTDNFPISSPAYPTNWELSTARSARVARYLIQAGHLEPGRFTIIGHAFYRPTVPHTTLENKAKNRRVEIVITRNEYKP